MPATAFVLMKAKAVTADGPGATTDEWVRIDQYHTLNVRCAVSAVSGTTPRLLVYLEVTDDPTATTGTKVLASEIDFADQAEDVILTGIPVASQYGRIQRDISGTTPRYVLAVDGIGIS